MPERDEASSPVSISSDNLHDASANMKLTRRSDQVVWFGIPQLLVPGLLAVRLRHVRRVAQAGSGGRGHANAGVLPEEDGN